MISQYEVAEKRFTSLAEFSSPENIAAPYNLQYVPVFVDADSGEPLAAMVNFDDSQFLYALRHLKDLMNCNRFNDLITIDRFLNEALADKFGAVALQGSPETPGVCGIIEDITQFHIDQVAQGNLHFGITFDDTEHGDLLRWDHGGSEYSPVSRLLSYKNQQCLQSIRSVFQEETKTHIRAELNQRLLRAFANITGTAKMRSTDFDVVTARLRNPLAYRGMKWGITEQDYVVDFSGLLGLAPAEQ